MHAFLEYACRVFGLRGRLAGIVDRRLRAAVPTFVVVRLLFALAVLRIRSFNALDPRLAERSMQRFVGVGVRRSGKIASVDTLAYALHRMDLDSVRTAAVRVVQKAERNKCFREGWFGALRYGAIDAWEMFSSRKRRCPACLTRKVKVGGQRVTEYYHRYVVALLLGADVEVVLDIEPIRSADVRAEAGEAHVEGHEGETTAAKRLVARVRTTYGRWIEVLVLDALYANGPFLTLAREHGFGVVVVLKKPTDEPFKEALALWNGKASERVIHDRDRAERIELWDCPQIETLETYKGDIRVVRAVVHKAGATEPNTWVFGVTGAATRLAADRVVAVGRARWHIENTSFHQWAHRWHFGHVFTHGSTATTALLWIFVLAFNLLQLFVYRQLGTHGRRAGKDPTRTILRLVDEMLGDYERLDETFAWDTS